MKYIKKSICDIRAKKGTQRMEKQAAYPQIYLAIDNCFAYKRWTSPQDWARVITELGVRYVEASADTELDPLYMGKPYLRRWIEQVKQAEEIYDLKVVNLYSGHGTYSTLGLTHTDSGVRQRMEEEWFRPMIETAASLEAGMGFFAHGFSETVMQDAEEYEQYRQVLIDTLGRLTAYGAETGCGKLGVEQMYVPYMIPWTMEGTRALLKEVRGNTGHDFYFTEDLGHHHKKFRMPSREEVRAVFAKKDRSLWLGADKTAAIYDRALERGELSHEDLEEIEKQMQQNQRFFAGERDGDCYEWLRELGCYSPIIHLQQTDGVTSAHKPFTKEMNQWGKIDGQRVLKALKESYDRETEAGMPKRCGKIYLTLELFSSTTQTTREILDTYKESVQYWRQFIPEDGKNLAELLKE